MGRKNEEEAEFPPFLIPSSELDFFTFIEHDYPPPIAFENRTKLQKWAEEGGLRLDALGDRDEEKDVVLVHGRYRPWYGGDGLYYRQVWVSVHYRRYRNAIKFLIRKSEGQDKPIGIYDGDHAVGKTRLKTIWPEAWVNMVLVDRRINRAIGSMLEKDPLVPDSLSDGITINTECILKTFLTRQGKLSRTDVRSYLREARQRFAGLGRQPSSYAALEMGLAASVFFSDLEHDLEDSGFFAE